MALSLGEDGDETQVTGSTTDEVEEIQLGDAHMTCVGASSQKQVNATEVKVSATPADEVPLYQYDYSKSFRWRMLILFSLMAALTGPMINTTALQDLILRNGAYVEECSGLSDLKHPYAKCNAMKIAADQLDSLAFTLIFAFTGVSGILLDAFGGKVCSLIGLSSQLLGWIFMFSSGPNFNGYKLAIIFLSAGVEPTFFGFLSVANLFPANVSSSIAVLGASRSLASGVPQIAMQIVKRFDSLQLSHIAAFFGCMIVLWAAFVVFCLPFQPFPSLPPGVFLDSAPGAGKILYTEHVNQKPKISWKRFKPAAASQAKAVWSHARRWPYWILIGLVTMTFIRQGYYLRVGIRSILTNDRTPKFVDPAYNVFSIVSFIPCLVLGYLADRFSRSQIISFLMFSGAATLFTLLINTLAFDIISLFFNWLCLSFVASQFYCFVGYCYPQKQMGTLVGFAFTVSALIALIPSGLTVSRLDNLTIFTVWSCVFGTLCVLGGIGAIILYMKLEKPLLAMSEENKLQSKCQNLSQEAVC